MAALADLTEISSQIEAAVIVDEEGKVVAATPADDARAERLARTASDLLAAAPTPGGDARTVTQLEVALREGSVFVAREGSRSIVATTSAAPTSGLVFYDLRTCLRSLDEPPPKRTRKARPKPKAKTDPAPEAGPDA